MEIRGPSVLLRPWRHGDEENLVAHANDREIWRNLTNQFPHPYTRADAQQWIAHVQSQGELTENFATVVDSVPVGGIGLKRGTDLRTKTAEVGYWVGRKLWGRGIATEALQLLSEYAFREFDFERLEATVIEWNPASFRVLEKAGFEFEARQLRAIFKDGRIADGITYRRLRPR
ncbi:MAG: GNAT family N-acetyltransferase [Nitrospiraceae bacterium]